ncbi:MAG TPA: hypothetical protein VN838_15600 [Bradyrhizobium sp.]|nr:hypothetical protein [Bradyrhizobium sp.]
MPKLSFRFPDEERAIIWRYLDGVSQALARRFDGGSRPVEENLTFLLCELLDEGTTGLHLLEYPLTKAKEDLARADGGLTLDVSFQTHEHTKHVEHHFSGADLGVVFVVEHPYFGRSEKAVLLQAKKLFPGPADRFTLDSFFKSFHSDQRELLKKIQRRFSADNSIFYLWYAPASRAFSDDEAKIIRSMEAIDMGWHPYLDELIEFRGLGYRGRRVLNPPAPEDDERERAWRIGQPATRVSSLPVVDELTRAGRGPSINSLYKARSRHRPWRWFAFEPFAELFLFALQSDQIGNSSNRWLQLARGEKVAMPPEDADADEGAPDLPEVAPAPKHSITFTLRSSLPWPEGLYRSE